MLYFLSESDPYQAVEGKYRLTREVLEILANHDFAVLILTRSPLALRDLGFLKKLSWIKVGFSISAVPEILCELCVR